LSGATKDKIAGLLKSLSFILSTATTFDAHLRTPYSYRPSMLWKELVHVIRPFDLLTALTVSVLHIFQTVWHTPATP
jgi:hypothetical protein